MVKADSAQLQQCILNICDNAALAMTSMRENEQDYGGVLTASIDLIYPDKKFRAEHPKAKQSSYWCLSITDTGVGMSRETIADIFDPFYTTRDPSESTGLGLTLVRDIIQQHNGFLEVDSAPGQGSVFRIYLPEITRAGTDSASKRQTEVSASDQIPTGSGLIFVVDDEDIMRKTAGNILEKLGYDVIFAEDGEEAVSIYRENFKDIKVVLLDMAMPKMSGKDAYIEMKKINPKIKSLLVSGFKKDDRIAEALEAGINGFIQKPYSMITLAQEVKRLSLAG
jgi:CheY-like chemotaxis protein